MYRLVLAGLITIAVAFAPMASAFAASAAMAKPAMQDCHGHKKTDDHTCCDAMAQCPDQCGVKCCKLMGVIAHVPVIEHALFAVPEAIELQKPPEWRLRPRPPPPRT